MVETTLTQDALLAALDHHGDEVRFVMECLTKTPPEGIVEIEGGSIWTGLAPIGYSTMSPTAGARPMRR